MHLDLIITRLEAEVPVLLLEGIDLGLGVVAQAEEPGAGGTIQQHTQVPQRRLHLALKGEGWAAAQQPLRCPRALTLLQAEGCWHRRSTVPTDGAGRARG